MELLLYLVKLYDIKLVYEFVPKEVEALQAIDLDSISKGREGGNEENVKNLMIIPLIKLLGYSSPIDVDFEYKTKSGRADIALYIDGKPKVIVEVKSLEQNLCHHIEQALEYAVEKQIGYVML